MLKVQDQHGSWVFLVPISNLILTDAVNYEIKVVQVTFVSAKYLPRRRKRLGIPERISDLRKRSKGEFIERLFQQTETFAVLHRTGIPVELENEVLRLIREELAILVLSQVMYKRGSVYIPAISRENPPCSVSYLVLNTCERSLSQPNRRVGNYMPLTLDENWRKLQRTGFWNKLVAILRGDISVGKGWRGDLRNAAIMVGQSLASPDVPHAFLWNMIALEILLAPTGDKHKDALSSRAEAFLGWSRHWEEDDLDKRISEIYRKRCQLVHEGQRDHITLEDLFFTDDLLANLLLNIVFHHQLFRSKIDIEQFSKKVEAEHLLGIKSKVRPKTLVYLRRAYTDRDYQL